MNIVFKLFVFVVSLSAVAVQPVFAQELERGKKGTLACVGNHDFRQGGSEINFTSYTFRNFNADTAISIDAITIFTADGMAVKSMPSPDPFPPDFNNVLSLNQTANFTTRDVFGDIPQGRPRPTPLQTVVKWSATTRGAALYASAARQHRGRDPIGGGILEQRARGLLRCVSLKK